MLLITHLHRHPLHYQMITRIVRDDQKMRKVVWGPMARYVFVYIIFYNQLNVFLEAR